MRIVSKIDGQGLYIEDVRLEDDEATPYACMEGRPPEGFHAPRWDAQVLRWVEGKPAAEIAEALKPQKVAEMHAAALDELAPLFTPGKGEHELTFLLAAHVKQICEALGIQADPRLEVVEEIGQKALARRDVVEAATSAEELEAVDWQS